MMGAHFDGLILLRILVLVLAVTQIGLTWAVWHAHFQAWKKNRGSHRGLLPYHVWVISTSHLIGMGYMTLDVLDRVARGLSLTWHGPALLVSSMLGVTALVIVLRYEVKRKTALRNPWGPNA